jgi:hypothetical protein
MLEEDNLYASWEIQVYWSSRLHAYKFNLLNYKLASLLKAPESN